MIRIREGIRSLGLYLPPFSQNLTRRLEILQESSSLYYLDLEALHPVDIGTGAGYFKGHSPATRQSL